MRQIYQIIIALNFFVVWCNGMDYRDSEENCFCYRSVRYNSIKEVENKCYQLLEDLNSEADSFKIPDSFANSSVMKSDEQYKHVFLWLKRCSLDQARDLAYIIQDLNNGLSHVNGEKWLLMVNHNNGLTTDWDDDGSRVGLQLHLFHNDKPVQRCSLSNLKDAMHNLIEKITSGWKGAWIHKTNFDGYVYQNEPSDEEKVNINKYRQGWLLKDEGWFFMVKPKIIPYEETILIRFIRLIYRLDNLVECFHSKDNKTLYLWLVIGDAHDIMQKIGLSQG